MWNPMWSVCENNVWISSMWNSRCFAIQWGLSTCERPCETPCEVYENMCEFKWGFTCESLCETPCEVNVKICVKGMTSLHTLFTYISLCKISHAREICVWNACEKCVKNVWKMCEKSVKIGHFSHVFHMVFHIHTPSSERTSGKPTIKWFALFQSSQARKPSKNGLSKLSCKQNANLSCNSVLLFT